MDQDKYKKCLADIYWSVLNSIGYKSEREMLEYVLEEIKKCMTEKELDEDLD